MTTMQRKRLADTRCSKTAKVGVGGWDVYITVSFYDNDQPGEVFVKVGKMGGVVSGFADMMCIFASMLLQVGVPMTKVVGKMQHQQFEPRDTENKSIADAVGKAMLRMTSEHGGIPDRDYNRNGVEWRPPTTEAPAAPVPDNTTK